MAEATSTYNPSEQTQTEGVTHIDELKLLSVNETRKLLGVSHITLKRLIEEGAIKAVRVNTRYKISLSAIREFTEGKINNEGNTSVPSSNQTPDSILDDLIHTFSK